MPHRDVVKRLVAREQALLGKRATVTASAVYWPLRVVRHASLKVVDPDLRRIASFIRAGYSHPSALRRRLQLPHLDEKLNQLCEMGLVCRVEGPDGSSYRVEQDRLFPSSPAQFDDRAECYYFDVPTDFQITLPPGAELLDSTDLDSSIPVLNGNDPPDETVVYVLCIAMLIQHETNQSRSVRVYCHLQRVTALEEILFDLVVEGSARLTDTVFTRRRPAQEAVQQALIETQDDELIAPVSKLDQQERHSRVEEAEPPRVSPSPLSQCENTVPSKARVEVVPGRRMHEEVLFEALLEARQRVVIVTPFVRARLRDINFLAQLRETLRRGVNITVIHGMPNLGGFDDTEFEDRRIAETLRGVSLNIRGLDPIKGVMRFHRVTSGPSPRRGEHSKILICDDLWAVVSSFNWLSIQETNETGIRVFDPGTVAELLREYRGYL